MLANPRHSRLVLVNPARSKSDQIAIEARWRTSLAFLPAAMEILSVPVDIIGDYDAGRMPDSLARRVTLLDVDGLSLWRDQRFVASLGTADIGVIVLGGAWLEEEVFISALEGVKLGYDVRVLADLSLARSEIDRSTVLDRLALHGVLPATLRQTLFEWAIMLDDPAVKQDILRLLS